MSLKISEPSENHIEWTIFYNNVGIALVIGHEYTNEETGEKCWQFNIFKDDSIDEPSIEDIYQLIKSEIFSDYNNNYSFSFLYVETFGNHNIAGREDLILWRLKPEDKKLFIGSLNLKSK
jgi:hypothetical protein